MMQGAVARARGAPRPARAVAPVVALLLLLAGCSSPEAGEGDTTDGGQPQFNDKDRDFVVDQPTLPVDPPLPGERNLSQVPTWRLGEWWKIRLTSFIDEEVDEFHRVVAGTEHGNYLVGFPVQEFSNYAMVMHHPAYGDINRSDLSYDTHDHAFKHLTFPMTVGARWDTYWQSATAVRHFEVTEVDAAAGTARIEITQTTQNALGQSAEASVGYVLYDAAIGEAREMVFNGYGKVEVIGHGYNWTGAVRVPHAHDLVFFHGRLGALPIGQSSANPLIGPVGAPTGPDETIEVDTFYDRVSFAIIMVDVAALVAGAPTAAGYYEQTATAPDGTEYALTMTPADQTGIKIGFFEHELPGGTWSLSTVAAGPGQVLFEGIGYHSIDIELPSGCVLPSGNALHHVTLCKAR